MNIIYENRNIIMENNTDKAHDYKITLNNKEIETGIIGVGEHKEVNVISNLKLRHYWEAEISVYIDGEELFGKRINSNTV